MCRGRQTPSTDLHFLYECSCRLLSPPRRKYRVELLTANTHCCLLFDSEHQSAYLFYLDTWIIPTSTVFPTSSPSPTTCTSFRDLQDNRVDNLRIIYWGAIWEKHTPSSSQWISALCLTTLTLLRRREGTCDTLLNVPVLSLIITCRLQYKSVIYKRYETCVNWAKVRLDTLELIIDSAQYDCFGF